MFVYVVLHLRRMAAEAKKEGVRAVIRQMQVIADDQTRCGDIAVLCSNKKSMQIDEQWE